MPVVKWLLRISGSSSRWWALCLLAPLGMGGAAQEPSHALAEAAVLYGEVRDMCADFQQVIEVRLLGSRTIESAGRVCQRRPNLFSMRFSDPDGDMVVSDGDHVWVYYPSIDEQQVTRFPAASSPGGRDFFREFLEDPGARYETEEGDVESIDGRRCRIVALSPLAGAAYRRARLWLDAETHVIRRLEVHERSGNVRTVTLRDLELSPEIDPGVFEFDLPAGVRVRDGGGAPS